jgi:WD40 repeat protein
LAAGDGEVRVSFSPREPLLAFSVVTGFKSPSPQHSIHLWNETTKQIVAQFALGGECMGLAFSDDGQNLVTYAGDPGNQITLWRIPTASKLVSYPVSPFNQMGTIAGTHFAMMCDMSVAVIAPDDTIHVIDLSTGEERWKAQAADELVKALAMSPDGKIIASGAGFAESAIRIWDMATGREITRLQDHRAWIGALAFWPDGKTLASVSADQTIRLWDLTDVTNIPPPRTLCGHSLEVWRLGLLPDSRTLVSGCKDGSICLWDTSTIQHEQMPIILPANVATWQFDPDNRSVLVLDSEGHLIRWKGPDFQDKEWLMDIGTGPGLSGLISRDGKQVAAGSANGTIRLWSLQDRRLLHESAISTGQVVPLEFTAQGDKLAVFHTNDSSVHEWDLITWQETCLWQGAAYQRPCVAFSKDGRWSLVVGWDGASSLRDIVTGRQTNQQLDVREADNATLSPDGRFLAVASSLGYFRLWETDTLKKSMTGRGFLMGVHSVAFSPDGKRLLTGSVASEAVKLWDVASCQELLTLEGQGSLFLPSAFSRDGNVIGSLNRRGDLHLWRAPSWAEIEAAEKSIERLHLTQ